MAKHALMKVEPIRSRFRLPPGAKIVGYLPNRDGSENFEYPIVRQKFTETRKVPVMRGGEQEWKLNPKGERYTAKYKLERTQVEREWVPAYGSGTIMRNFNFRPDADELAKVKRKAQVDDFRRRFEEAAVAAGADPVALVRSLSGKKAEKQEEKPTYPLAKSPGRWELSDGTIVRGKRADAEAEEAKLVEQAA